MQIVHYPHPALRWKSSDVTRIDDQLRGIVREMFDLMYQAKGIGLAANQVALPVRVFIMNPSGEPADKDAEMVFINPEIVTRKGSELGEEGCLSIPEVYSEVRRAKEIVVEAYDLDGQGFELTIDELPARVIQHETDHLDGVMFTDRVSESALRELEPVLSDFESVFRRDQFEGKYPPDDEIRRQLQALADELTGE
jgi:peptide deformylase